MIRDFWERETVDLGDDEARVLAMSSSIYAESLLRQFVSHKEEGVMQSSKSPLRPSNLSKPAVELFCIRFHPELYTQNENPLKLRQLFHCGDTWEGDAYFHLKRFGATNFHLQPPVTWGNGSINGHADIIAELNGVSYVWECKTVNEAFFKSLFDRDGNFKLESLKFRGYHLQAGLYAEALGIPAKLLIYNKNTSECLEIDVQPEWYADGLANVRNIIKVWNEVETWNDIFSRIRIPSPRKEYRDKRWTGRWMLPISMYNAASAQLVYDIVTDDDGKRVVVDYIYPPEHIHLKPELEQL